MADVDSSIDRILTMAAAAGMAASANPASDDDIAALRSAVSPLRLPEDLERLYRRFQDGPPGLIDGLDLLPISEAIEFREAPEWPKALLTIAYASHWFRLVELHGPEGTGGGAVWEVAFTDLDLREVAPSLADLLDAVATAWERGIPTPFDHDNFRTVEWDPDVWDPVKAELLPKGRVVSVRPTHWLPRWLEFEGLNPRDSVPHGATSTVAALLAAPEAWTETAIVSGRVTSIIGTAFATSAVLDDGTGELVVYVPRAADPFRLLRVRSLLELDVSQFPVDGQIVAPFDAAAFQALATAVRRDESA